MAITYSVASGNLTSSSTWALVNSTSYANSETSTVSVTTDFSGARSDAFTPGNITISHIGIRVKRRIDTTGTITVRLELDADNSEVAGTSVTIDCADLPDVYYSSTILSIIVDGGWVFFKLASPVTLAAATAYQVAVQTSNASQVTLYGSTTSNLSRALVTTTNQAPGAGDDMIVAGEHTGQGTYNSVVVTMDQTTNVDYGAASTSTVTPALSISNLGTLKYAFSAATNYQLKISGHVIIYKGGSFIMGDATDPCPRDSTMLLHMDCTTNGGFGITVRPGGSFTAHGLSRTAGKDIVKCKLTQNVLANGTTFNIDTDTGWLDNDVIAIADHGTSGISERGALNGNAGVSSLTVDGFGGGGGGILTARVVDSFVQPDIILITRNVRVIGNSSLATFMECGGNLNLKWVEFTNFGTSSSRKRGIDLYYKVEDTADIQYCSFNGPVGVGCASNLSGLANSMPNTFIFSNNVSYQYIPILMQTVTNGYTITDNVSLYTVSSAQIYSNNGVFARNTFANHTSGTALTFHGISGYPDEKPLGTFEDITVYGSSAHGVTFDYRSRMTGTIDRLSIIRCASSGFTLQSANDVTFRNTKIIGSNTSIYNSFSYIVNATFVNGVFGGEVSYPTDYNILLGSSIVTEDGISADIKFIDCDFTGVQSGLEEANIYDMVSSAYASHNYMNFTFINSFLKENPFDRYLNLNTKSTITSINHNQVIGDNRLWLQGGLVETDTITVNAPNTTSFKLSPSTSYNRKLSLRSRNGAFRYKVSSGNNVQINVAVREDVTYNGNRARLVLKANGMTGMKEDSVLDTATNLSENNWEILTGTVSAIPEDGYIEFLVDCDGTAGSLYVDWPTVTVI